MFTNPYVQVALTYLRRPFSSWVLALISTFFICLLGAVSLAGRVGTLKDPVYVQLMLFLSLAIFLTIHVKGQFVDWRAHLTPRYRRAHAVVAAAAILICAAILPAILAGVLGVHPLGLAAVSVLLFGATAWVIVQDATWTCFALAAAWTAFISLDSGQAWFRSLLSGQLAVPALAILGLGALAILLAGIRLIRCDEGKWTYDSTLHLDSDWGEKTRRGWSPDGRILPGLRDGIQAREMARLTRLARRAPESPWARVCRWQAGMMGGCSLGLLVLAILVLMQAMNWWITTRTPRPAVAMMGLISMILTFLPAVIAAMGVFQTRRFKLGLESLRPVQRSNHLRQVGMAVFVNHFQLWGGLSAALVLWWLLVGPRPLLLASLGGVLLFSAAFQLLVFGVAVWTARERSGLLAVLILSPLFFVTAIGSPERWPRQASWIAPILAMVALLVVWDAYRRWLVADLE